MNRLQEPSATTDDRRMIDAWVASCPPGLEAEPVRRGRLAAEERMIRNAMTREAIPAAPWRDDVQPALLR